MKKLLLISVLFFTIKANSKETRVLQSPSFGRVGVAKCPIKQGNIIYAFRNLYNYITQEIHEFEDNCDDAAARGGSGNNYGFIRLKQKQIKQILNNNIIKIYPNPAKNVVNVNCKNIFIIQVTDLLGRNLINNKSNGVNTKQLNVSNLQKGIYIIKITTTDKKVQTEKLIIN